MSGIATIGNFDGGHLGHQALMRVLKEQAEQRALMPRVMTFAPLTRDYFNPASAQRLMRLRDRLAWLQQPGIQTVQCLRFHRAFANLSATEFIDRYLKAQGIKAVVVGENFRFGAGGAGDAEALKAAGLELYTVPAETFQGERISSSWLRRLLSQGDFSLAQTLLGRPYTFGGRVIPGAQRGRQLGFPTANLSLRFHPLPLSGVYAVCLRQVSTGLTYAGVANIGVRPTFSGDQRLCEVHVLGFSGSLYGQSVEIIPYQKIREERTFSSVEALKAQIKQDIDRVQEGLTQ